MILAIDPGPNDSAYVLLDSELRPIEFDKCPNLNLVKRLGNIYHPDLDHCAIEMVASYGMPVGAEVFETVFWIGRFWEIIANQIGVPYVQKIYRKDEKINLCGSMKAKDGNIRQALIDRFGPVGVKKSPGWFYGVSKDVWAAIAVGVTYHDLYLKGEKGA